MLKISKLFFKVAVGACLIIAPHVASAQRLDVNTISWEVGTKTVDSFDWVEVRAGDMPVVISVPHGGSFHDEQIADRACNDIGRVVKGIDRNTIQISNAMQNAFKEINGTTPYMVVAKLSRRKVDQNREINLATCGDELGKVAWENYHNALDATIKEAVRKFGYVFFVDMHGHGHEIQRLELGYSLTTKQLQDLKNEINTTEFDESSLANLFNVSKKQVTYQDLLFGPHSIGAQMENQAIPSTPSFHDPHPVDKQPFFAGGYITRRYTGKEYPNVFGLQIECYFKGVRDTKENRAKFATAFVNSYNHFIENFL